MGFINEELPSPEAEALSHDWFKQQSLKALATSLSRMNYPGYPAQRLHEAPDIHLLPEGPWHMPSESAGPTDVEAAILVQNGHRLDMFGRPLHPWLEGMLSDPDIGVVTGKGFYWKWGPNYTVDPITFRHDLSETHVLLIERDDGTGWALPGGFHEADETKLDGAIREGREESGVDLSLLTHTATHVYEGPLADLRATAHAWPETTAYRFDLLLDNSADRKLLEKMMSTNRRQRAIRILGRFAFTERINQRPWKGRDDARNAAWVPVSELDDKLFGSHRLLIELALQA